MTILISITFWKLSQLTAASFYIITRFWLLSDKIDGLSHNDISMETLQMYRTDKYSEHSSAIWSVWPNDWVFVCELNSSGFESSCSHLNFRFRTCFEQGVPWNSGNYRVSIHSETRTCHDKNMQLITLYLVNIIQCYNTLLFETDIISNQNKF